MEDIKTKIQNAYFGMRQDYLSRVLIRAILSLEKKYNLKNEESRKKVFSMLEKKREVLFGPFKGLKYSSDEAAYNALTKIVGTYEKELFSLVEELKNKDYEVIINIGSAEGYYAIGLARSIENAVVYAYDIDPDVRERLKEMIKANGLEDRINVGSFCDINELEKFIKYKSGLIVSDCESYELELFQESIIEKLKHFDFLIESHDGYKKHVTKQLNKRFRKHFTLRIVKQQKRKPGDFHLDLSISKLDKIFTMNEGRGAWLRWIFATDK